MRSVENKQPTRISVHDDQMRRTKFHQNTFIIPTDAHSYKITEC